MASLSFAPLQGAPPNVLIVVADDLGVDLVNAYGVSSEAPCTPTMDRLAAEGMLFRNAWSNPICTPSRAALLTGRHGFRTGLGQAGGGTLLKTEETTLAEALRDSGAGYTTAAYGKWHLAGNGPTAPVHPFLSGFQQHAGTLGGALPDYESWIKVVNGVVGTEPVTTYATVDTTQDAFAAVTTLPEPWFVYVAYNAPHDPIHVPPAELCPDLADCPNSSCADLGPDPSVPARVRAMVEVFDNQLARLLAGVDEADTIVLFVGDNGTFGGAAGAPFEDGKAKGTVFQGGVNVPFIVKGPGVAVGETEALVGLVDVFATVGEWAGLELFADDSVSFAGVLQDPELRPRDTLYTERFSPNGASLPIANHRIAVRDERFKLHLNPDNSEELYDLRADPYEQQDLLPAVEPELVAARDSLRAAITSLHTGASLVGEPAAVGIAAGGAQQLVIAPGQAFAGEAYFVVGSASGASPGTPLGGLIVPLNLDSYTTTTVLQANGPVFQQTLGVLPDQGSTRATIALPEGLDPGLIGLLLHHASLVLAADSGEVTFASEAVALRLTP